MFALNVDDAKRIALVVVIAALVLALLAAKFVKAALVKAVVILLLGSLVAVTYSQRSNMSNCASQIRDQYTQNDFSQTKCEFLGFEFTVTTVGGNVVDG